MRTREATHDDPQPEAAVAPLDPKPADSARRADRAPRPRRADRPGPAAVASRRSLQIGFALTALIVAGAVLYLIRDVMGAFVLGALLAFVVGPLVDRLESHRVPRPIGILAVFGVLVAVLIALVFAVLPLLLTELEGLRSQVPALAAEAQSRLNHLQGRSLEVSGFRVDLTMVAGAVNQHANDFLLGQFGNALSFGITALTTAFQLVLMLIVAFLVAVDSHRISRALRSVVPVDYRPEFDGVWGDIKAMLFAYMRGQLIIAAMIGVGTGVAVQVIGLPYALALGLLAAITSLVPYLGPFLGAVPAILIGLAVSPQKALVAAIAYLIVSNIILNFVFPKVMGDAVKLPPILVIMSFLAGFSLAGILGMFVAIPIAATLRILYDHIHPRLFGEPPQPATA